ncbi:MAG: hypothetical protein ACLSA2_11490 [Candidatus Gastranaerophilaceae bacterium]
MQGWSSGTKLSKLACENGLSGLEFMIAFPGSVGGEVFMVRAHGQMIADVLSAAKICPVQDIYLSKDEMEFNTEHQFVKSLILCPKLSLFNTSNNTKFRKK